jgi:hypothetical protein
VLTREVIETFEVALARRADVVHAFRASLVEL